MPGGVYVYIEVNKHHNLFLTPLKTDKISITLKLKEALKLAGGRDGHPRWWLSPEGELNPCTEHEYAAREIIRSLGMIPAPGRELYDQMFNHGWVRVVREKTRVGYETSRTLLREANREQLPVLKELAIECGLELYNLTTSRNVVLGELD